MRFKIALLLGALAVPAFAEEPLPAQEERFYGDEAREPSDRETDRVLRDQRKEPHERSITAKPFEDLLSEKDYRAMGREVR